MAIAGLALIWLLQPRDLRWAALRGVSLLSRAENAAELDSALERWSEETGRVWRDRPMDLVDELLSDRFCRDERARRLLAFVSGADYGDRLEEWREWRSERARRAQGEALVVKGPSAVNLRALWQAPVGLTHSCSTLIACDGRIYVPSMGTGFGALDDEYDGVVRVDGVTGAADLFFSPPSRAPRDVMGLTLARDKLFVACRNGALHCVRVDGTLEWTTNCGAPLSAAPLAVEGARGVEVVVISDSGQLMSLNAGSGRANWTTKFRVPAGLQGDPLAPEATFSLTLLRYAQDAAILAAHSRGAVEAFSVRDGRPLWRASMDAGIAGHPVSVYASAREGRQAYLFGADGWLAALPPRNGQLEWVGQGASSAPADLFLRTLRTRDDMPAMLLSTTRGESDWRGGLVAAQAASGELLWRYASGGAIRSTPAVADLNADGAAEILLGVTLRGADGAEWAWLTTLSARGQCLSRELVPAGLNSPPLVADVNQDGRLEALVADGSGLLRCYTTGRFGAVQWGSLRGDAHNTGLMENGFSYGQAPPGYQGRWRPR